MNVKGFCIKAHLHLFQYMGVRRKGLGLGFSKMDNLEVVIGIRRITDKSPIHGVEQESQNEFFFFVKV